MIAVALKGLAARKVRALLTALAVVIGVSMISGTYILTDTMQKAFDGIFDSSYAQTDAVIGGKEIVKGSTSGSATVPTVAAVATDEPDVAAKIAQAPILECIRPPGIQDSHLIMASYMRSATPARSRISPSRMNIGIETSRKSLLDDHAISHMASESGMRE